MNDTLLKQYLLDVKKLLPCSSSEKKRCIMELEADASAFLETHPNATLEELYACVGSPTSIAKSFMSRTNPEQLCHQFTVKRKVVISVVVIATLLAISLSAIAYIFADNLQHFFDGYYVDSVEEYDTLPSDATPQETPIAVY